jgi:hypothetical protein
MALADEYAADNYLDESMDKCAESYESLRTALTEALANGTQIVRTIEPIDTYLEPVQNVGENVHIVGCVNHDCALCKDRAAQQASHDFGCHANAFGPCTCKAAQPVRDDEFATRGELAARLKCWHRLTGEESDELVDLLRAQPVREPLTDEQIAELIEYLPDNSDEQIQDDPAKFIRDLIRAMELAHGIGADK